jgi:phosphomevalonate kinase
LIARAPGKLVLSGAYAVLEGAPALVAAVDRYVTADAGRPAELVTAEVSAAIAQGALERAPWFDASALRTASPDGTTRKLGVGSSAAILVASLAASRPSGALLPGEIFPLALAAHRRAQPGGSGIDVAASTFGGVLRAAVRRSGEGEDHALDLAPHALPEGLVIEVFGSPVSASTARFLEQVRALAERDRPRYRRLLDAATEGAVAAVAAVSVAALRRAIDAQIDALAALGEAAGAAIVTPEVAALRPVASAEEAAFGPSGAGGGDIALYMGAAPSSARFRESAGAQGFTLLDIRLGADGVHRVG